MENFGWFWGTHMLCGPSSSKALAIPMPSHCHVLKAEPDLVARSFELEKSSLQLQMSDRKGAEHP